MLLHLSRSITWAVGIVCLVQVLTGCGGDKPEDRFVARVGEAVLTKEHLFSMSDSLGVVHTHPGRTVEGWITSEVLYQEAVRRGYAETDHVRQTVESIRRRLIVQALLDEALYASDTVSVNEDAILTMYNAEASAFLLREDVVLASYVLFSDRDAANTFRSAILKGTSWDDAMNTVRQDSLSRSQLLLSAKRQYFTRASLYPEELWKLARSLPDNETSFVLRTDAGYYVVTTHGTYHVGEKPSLDYIKDEIRERLLIDHRRLTYERMLSDLWSKAIVRYGVDFPDTTATVEEMQ